MYFFHPAAIEPKDGQRNRDIVTLDEDEWPGQALGQRYGRGDPVLHIELRRWADLFLIAPLDANTLAKLACGLCDNCLTCVWRAWDRARPVILAPAMNTLMWENPLTRRHMTQIAEDAQAAPPALELPALIEWINGHCPGLRIVAPIAKKLACEDVGMGAMAERCFNYRSNKLTSTRRNSARHEIGKGYICLRRAHRLSSSLCPPLLLAGG